jgi:hypothetical protein
VHGIDANVVGPCCIAAALVKVRTAPFGALQATWAPCCPVMPEIDEVRPRALQREGAYRG